VLGFGGGGVMGPPPAPEARIAILGASGMPRDGSLMCAAWVGATSQVQVFLTERILMRKTPLSCDLSFSAL
jgi:hypothetical protein